MKQFWAVSKGGRVLLLTEGTAAWEHVLRSGNWQRCDQPVPGQPWPTFDPAAPALAWDAQAQAVKTGKVVRTGKGRRRVRPPMVPVHAPRVQLPALQLPAGEEAVAPPAPKKPTAARKRKE